MNITEANAAQTLLQALTNITVDGAVAGKTGDDLLPTVEQVTEAVGVLADRSSTALKTGITADRAVEALRARRGYPYRLRLAIQR